MLYGEKAVRLLPEKVEYRLNLGRAYEGMHRIEDATEQYRVAIQLNPESIDGYVLLMGLLEREGKIAEAIGCCENFARVSHDRGGPEESEAFRQLGRLYARLGKMEEAENYLQKAIEVGPQHQAARRTLDDVRA